jgi:hypothetical protein
VLERSNVKDEETEWFEGVDYFSPENEREVRREWTR